MKQHITKEQWNELSRDAKNTWYEFALKRGYVKHTVSKWDGGINYETKSEMDTPNIGQMIEYILMKKGESKEPGRMLDVINQIDEDNLIIGWMHGELCDALWEAVKTHLES